MYLGDDSFKCKNWDNVLETVAGRLKRWKLPHMSFKGCILVINNLVSSMLWHRLACVDPSVSPGQDTSFVDQLLLGLSALGSTEHAVSAQGGQRTGAHPPGQQGQCFPTLFHPEAPSRSSRLVWRPIARAILSSGLLCGSQVFQVHNPPAHHLEV